MLLYLANEVTISLLLKCSLIPYSVQKLEENGKVTTTKTTLENN